VDRLAKEKNAAIVGTVQQVLYEDPLKNNPNTPSVRAPRNKIVIFEGDADRMAGEIPNVCVEGFPGFTTSGTPLLVGV